MFESDLPGGAANVFSVYMSVHAAASDCVHCATFCCCDLFLPFPYNVHTYATLSPTPLLFLHRILLYSCLCVCVCVAINSEQWLIHHLFSASLCLTLLTGSRATRAVATGWPLVAVSTPQRGDNLTKDSISSHIFVD